MKLLSLMEPFVSIYRYDHVILVKWKKTKNTAAKRLVCKDIEFRRIINAFFCKKPAYNQIYETHLLG